MAETVVAETCSGELVQESVQVEVEMYSSKVVVEEGRSTL